MEADFSGWATKAGLKCSDGRTIMPRAFEHQDKMQVPLVWQHGHTDPTNVLGHVLLENRKDGVYAYAYFNKTEKAQHAKEAVEHQDITQLSIWANQLVERSKQVWHGVIREVSLVLSGANPGAIIQNVQIRHSADEDDIEILPDDAIIHTGLALEHAQPNFEEEVEVEKKPEDSPEAASATTEIGTEAEEVPSTAKTPEVSETTELEHKDNTPMATAADDKTVQEIFDSFSDEQKQVVEFLIGEAIDSAGDGGGDSMSQSEFLEAVTSVVDTYMKGTEMAHRNVFESEKDPEPNGKVLSHSELSSIMEQAKKEKTSSLKSVFEDYALAHGIENIDVMFPEAVAVDKQPAFLQRRVEWVADWIAGTTKTPFSRIKNIYVDLTFEEARARGYVTGTLKKEEFIKAYKRITTPTTVYKKQKLDRDDIVDITDFDVVVWLKAEMRLMLDEEVARAALVGDGRESDDDDKVNEENIRPIANDNDVYATTVYVNIDDLNSSVQEIIDQIVSHRAKYKGSGTPNFYTTEPYIARFMLLRDTLGRRIYQNLAELAQELRVGEIIPVEAMEAVSELVGIMVNPVDYVYGATRGGEVNMFDFFDIDYNQQKYLIETRLCGALNKPKSAIVVKKVAANAALVSPTAPTFDATTGALTITDTTGVTYKKSDGTTVTHSGSPYTVASGSSETITAFANSGYYFDSSDNDSWAFTAD